MELLLFLERPAQLVTREKIAGRLWGKDFFLKIETALTPWFGDGAPSLLVQEKKRENAWATRSAAAARLWHGDRLSRVRNF